MSSALDVFQRRPEQARAFLGTYQLLGYLRGDRLVQLSPHRKVDTVKPSFVLDQDQPPVAEDPRATLEAISFYETAAYRYTHGFMRTAR